VEVRELLLLLLFIRPPSLLILVVVVLLLLLALLMVVVVLVLLCRRCLSKEEGFLGWDREESMRGRSVLGGRGVSPVCEELGSAIRCCLSEEELKDGTDAKGNIDGRCGAALLVDALDAEV